MLKCLASHLSPPFSPSLVIAWPHSTCSCFIFSIPFLLSWQFTFHSFFQLLMPHLYNNFRTLYPFIFMHGSPHALPDLMRNDLSQLIDSDRSEAEAAREQTLLYRMNPFLLRSHLLWLFSNRSYVLDNFHPFCNG